MVDYIVLEYLFYTIMFLALLAASLNDIKTREVPDWLNFALITSGIGIRIMASIIYNDISIFLHGLLGLGVFVAIAYLMFYLGQWGGGDAKLLMGMGAMIGLEPRIFPVPFLISFFMHLLLVGAVYGLLWSASLAIVKRKEFTHQLRKTLKDKKIRQSHMVFWAAGIVLFIISLFSKDIIIMLSGIIMSILVVLTYYLWIFVKAIEEACMKRYVAPEILTIGDWIAEDVYYKKKYICGPKDLGVEEPQLKLLKKLYKEKKIGKVLLKEGIPFVPSFFLAFVLTIAVGNVFLLLV